MKRYRVNQYINNVHEEEHGPFVLFSDAEAEIEKARREEWSKGWVDPDRIRADERKRIREAYKAARHDYLVADAFELATMDPLGTTPIEKFPETRSDWELSTYDLAQKINNIIDRLTALEAR